ncbi:cupin domain-containing protein [Truepera radiovictrix]|uniref:Cupin 2 conserved barrel domain protein n=1 Tax=Truepera radiovictrix (strain DSM 17093 / CIP 108686 / LMG 22925 / RQ-24) TaxID=649638 RepID=D7CVV9_TRURR|nr:cupin domain-containing protein [Truepera radiovictrix]ADI16020.1 Cupin 2 conserved barrel domain protein [Truepera radiovictrix DSM 17093]WMT58354.1 cupin domain-containing protein [Truepera radiovictrix]
MKLLQLEFNHFFEVVAETKRAQAAVMTLPPGQRTGGEDNVHETSDQWLFVVSGRGEATVAGERVTLAPGSLLIIEAGETHEIAAQSAEPLRTLNLYTPPEY